VPKIREFFLLSAYGKKKFTQQAKQTWLRCYYHYIDLYESRQWHMQSIFCSENAHEAI
jgi:hypothetical protein